MISKDQAQHVMSLLEEILQADPNHILIKRSYRGAMTEAARSIKRRIEKGEFPEEKTTLTPVIQKLRAQALEKLEQKQK